MLVAGGLVAPGSVYAVPAGAGVTAQVEQAGQLTWSTLSPPAAPPALEHASAVYDSDNHTVVLFGGQTSNGSLSSDTWVWNGDTWTDYSPSRIQAPPARELAAMGFDPELHQLILFGGRGPGGRELGDTWAWNGASWYNVTSRLISPSPGAREGAAMAYDGRGELVLFGGDGLPGAQFGAASAGGQGRQAPSVLADTWLWGTAGWTQAPVTGPPARTSAAMAFDPVLAVAVLFGGSSGPAGSAGATPLGDTWTWDGGAWTAAAGPAPGAGTTSTTAAPTLQPGPRSSALLAGDPTAGGVVLYSGSGGSNVLGDTWVWGGSAWTPVSTAGSVPSRSGAAGAFDAAARQLVVFGGAGPTAPLQDTVALTDSPPVPLATTPAGSGAVAGQPGSTTTQGVSNPRAAASPGPGTSRTAPASGAGTSAASGSAKPHDVLHRGDLVTLTGAGFAPNTEVTVTFHSQPTVVGRTVSNAQGAFGLTVAVPQDAASGMHHFEATGATDVGRATKVIAAVEVVAPGGSSDPTLTETTALVGVALAVPFCTWLVLGGIGRLRRRRLTA